jgi:multiple sugar transport system permease protein
MTAIKNAIWSVRNFFARLRKKIFGNFELNLPTWLKGLLYLSPALILLGIFTFYPILNSFRLVFLRGYLSDETITGYTILGNFMDVLSTKGFILPQTGSSTSVFINTLIIVAISVPVSTILALLIATALNSIKPLKNFFQTIFFLPYVTNTIAIGLVFAYMFSGDFGLMNQFLGWLGIAPIKWMDAGATYWSAMTVLLVYTIWDSMAFKIMVFLSAIQGIDKQYYQAAEIDGASKSKVFRRITVPLISPMIFYILITSIIGAFKTYSSVVAIFGDSGAPAGATFNLKTIVFYIYDYLNTAGSRGNLSRAAAASIILFVFILLITLVQMYASKKRVHY